MGELKNEEKENAEEHRKRQAEANEINGRPEIVINGKENAGERLTASEVCEIRKVDHIINHEVGGTVMNQTCDEVIDEMETNEKSESEEIQETLDDVESGSNDSFISDSEDDDSECGMNNGSNSEVALTEAEVEELIDEFLDVESKAAEAQESLEKESLARVESEVRAELSETFENEELEDAVSEEMKTYIEQWQSTLDELETESSLLLEQLDGAGVELPKLFRLIESKAADCCSTEAWKRRAHWVGGELNNDLNEAINGAEKYLQSCRPVRRRHGRAMEEGASGFLAKKLMADKQKADEESPEGNWAAFSELLHSSQSSENGVLFGSKEWTSVYLASTPQQASLLGLNLPGVDEVEEIDEVPLDSCDPFYADAIANEKSIEMSEEQRRNFRKVREEEDAKLTRKLQLHLKKRRQRKKSFQKDIRDQRLERGKTISSEGGGASTQLNSEIVMSDDALERRRVNGGCSTSKECRILSKRCQILTSESEDDIQVIESNIGKDASSIVKIERDTVNVVNQIVDVVDIDSDPSTCQSSGKNDQGSFHCTVCCKFISPSEISRHPLLEVISCKSCYRFMKERMRYKDSIGAESFCGWCGKSGDLVKCKLCTMFFCVTCIKRTLDDKCTAESRFPNWQCFCCSPSQLKEFIMDCDRALAEFSVAGAGISSESSDSDIDRHLGKKRRRKKRIRRILEDTELAEETKEKIAIEKARQEHLMLMQFKPKSLGDYAVNNDATVLGDEISGYIVNVAREPGEEAIRIPPSLSGRLKPHQVSGIRFMWENIIQSVEKVKSGDSGLGCILAHTMGLGKTFQVIALLYAAMRSADIGLRRAIIVTPVNVLHNWRQEFIKWRPIELKALRVFMMDDVPRERRVDLLARWESKGGVLLIGYSSFRNLSLGKHVKDKNTASQICQFLQSGPDILICDEAHMIKNRRADITFALKQVKTQRRIALTGSPLQNNLMEYYCMVDFVREGFLGSSHEFRNRFQNPIEYGQHANSTSHDVKIMNQRSHILYEQLKGFVHRMDLNVTKKDLPPKTVFVITVKLSPMQRKLYKRFLDVHGFTNDKVSLERSSIKRCFFSGYQALSRVWNHPGLLQLVKEHKYNTKQEDVVENFLMDDISSDDNLETSEALCGEKQRTRVGNMQKPDSILFNEEMEWWGDLLPEKTYREVDYSGKIVLLLDILSMSYDVGDKVLVFSQSLPTLDLIELFLSRLPRKEREGKHWKQGKDWYRLDGRTEGSERQRLVEKFNDPMNSRVKCMLISTRAGSLGINLHAANRVVIVDGSWNPTNDLQAIYRVWRYGQIKPVYAYRLMAHGTMEEKIYKRQVTKEGLAARVVDRQQIYRTMSREEVLHLFDFGDDESVDHASDEAQKQSPLPLPLPHNTSISDKFMEILMRKHHPRWIASCHEHEMLLQENEDEKLSKEEQDMAWETFRATMEWEEVQRVIPVEDSSHNHHHHQQQQRQQHHHHNHDDHRQHQGISQQNKAGSVIRSQAPTARKCSNLSHLLTLRSQGTKAGSSTTCGECSQEISWESLNKDGKSR